MEIKRSELSAVAKELNEVLGLEPPIDFKAPVGELMEQLEEAIALIDPVDDEFTPETQAVIDQLMKEGKQEEQEEQEEEKEQEEEEGKETQEEQEEPEEEQQEEEQEEELQEEDTQETVEPQKAQQEEETQETPKKKKGKSYFAKIDEFIEDTDKPFTIEDVTKQVGCSKQYVYSYFPALVKAGVLIKSRNGRTVIFQKKNK